MLKLNVRLGALLVLCLAASSFAFGDNSNQRLVSIDIKINIRKDVNTKVAAESLAKGIGKVMSVSEHECVIRLADPNGLSDKLVNLRRQKSVAGLIPLAPIMPGEDILSRPTSELKQLVDEYKESYFIWANATSTPIKTDPSGTLKAPGLGYLEAYLQWKFDRSYPNQQIDNSGYAEIAQRRAMKQSEFGGSPKEAFGANTSARQIAEFLNLRNVIQPRSGGPQEDISGNWEFMGPRDLRVPYTIYFGASPVNGRANAVAIDPNNANTFYIGGAQGGVWKTTDAGVSWSTTSDGWPLLGVSSLAIQPGNSDVILAGTGDFYGSDVGGIGIMRSTNAGATWTLVGTNIGSSMVSAIVFHPDNPSIAFASTGRSGSGRLYRSTDGGVTWFDSVGTVSTWSDVKIGAQRGDGTRTVWAVSGGNPGLIRKSNNQGASWTTVTSPVSGSQNPLHIAPSRFEPDTAYLLSTTSRQIWKTINGGTNWTNVTAGFPNGSSNYNWSQGWYDYYINTSSRPDGAGGFIDVVYVGLIDIVMSINGGSTWRSIGGSNYTAGYSNTALTHVDHHNFAVDPSNPNRCVVTTDGGAFLMVYNPTADTVSWTRLNKALAITQFYTLAVHPTNPDYVKGGTQDNSTPHSFGNLIQWQNPGAGDGAGCGINWLDTNTQYNSSQNQGLYKTTNGYNSSSSFKPSLTGHSVPFIGKLWLDKNNPYNVYMNTNYLNRYDEVTNAWTMQLGGIALSASARINAFDVANGNSNILYTGAGDGDLYKSVNFGASWTKLDDIGGFTNRSIMALSVSPSNSNDILIGVGGSGNHLYRCADTSAATPSFVSVSGSGATGLPNVALTSIARDPWQPETRWYVATDVGVFQTSNAGATWEDITQPRGLPNVQVNELIANPTTGYLTAATFGRGIWRMKIVPAVVQSITGPNSVYSGDGDQLTVTIDRPAPAGGVSVPLSSNHPSLIVPASVTIPAGSNSANVPFTTVEITSNANVTVTATMGGAVTKSILVRGAANVSPNSVTLFNGVNPTGNLASFVASDDNKYSWTIGAISRRWETRMEATLDVSGASLGDVRAEFEFSTQFPNLNYQISFFNYSTNVFDEVQIGTTSTVDQLVTFTPNMTNYVNGSNQVRIRVNFHDQGNSRTSFKPFVDMIRLRLFQ